MRIRSSSIADVVVVGGGIVGAATCYYLSKNGVNCIVVERDGVASHASGKAFGGLHPRVQEAAGSTMQAFSTRAFQKHRELHEEISESGIETSTWKPRISISLAFDETQAEEFMRTVKGQAKDMKWIGPQELLEIEPRINKGACGGLWISNSAEVNSKSLTETLLRLSKARVLRGVAHRPLFKSDQVVGVELDSGEHVKGSRVVFAMGPWSNTALNWFELPNFIKPLKGQILRLRVPGGPLAHSFSIDGNYMSSKPDGLVWVGTTEEQVGFKDSITQQGRNEILRQFAQLVPNLDNIDVVKQTACIRPMPSDHKLLLGHVPGFDLAFIATGGGRKGILFGPLIGQVIADLITHSTPSDRWQTLGPNRLLNQATSEIAGVA